MGKGVQTDGERMSKKAANKMAKDDKQRPKGCQKDVKRGLKDIKKEC